MGIKPPMIETTNNIWIEIATRVFLAVIVWETESFAPFHRKIHPEELWFYKNPRTSSYVPTTLLWGLILAIPAISIFLCGLIRRENKDSTQAFLAISLSLGLNGVITNTIKLIVGRPRPDFFWRCFPDGNVNIDMNCTGDIHEIIEGYKSFPSGHSSFAFAGMGFTALYLAGKLHCFNPRGRGHAWRLCITLLPLIIAMMVALSRTVDYHHHWQDVLFGSILGLSISYVCYHQYYPVLSSLHCDRSIATLMPQLLNYQSDLQRSNEFASIKWI